MLMCARRPAPLLRLPFLLELMPESAQTTPGLAAWAGLPNLLLGLESLSVGNLSSLRSPPRFHAALSPNSHAPRPSAPFQPRRARPPGTRPPSTPGARLSLPTPSTRAALTSRTGSPRRRAPNPPLRKNPSLAATPQSAARAGSGANTLVAEKLSQLLHLTPAAPLLGPSKPAQTTWERPAALGWSRRSFNKTFWCGFEPHTLAPAPLPARVVPVCVPAPDALASCLSPTTPSFSLSLPFRRWNVVTGEASRTQPTDVFGFDDGQGNRFFVDPKTVR